MASVENLNGCDVITMIAEGHETLLTMIGGKFYSKEDLFFSEELDTYYTSAEERDGAEADDYDECMDYYEDVCWTYRHSVL